MPVKRCLICDQNPETKRRYAGSGLAEGKECPICYAPTCRYHLTTVRWRWKETGEVDSDQVCKECKSAYRHRDWDTLNREWIS